jgi:long-chain fatty acid transport protein
MDLCAFFLWFKKSFKLFSLSSFIVLKAHLALSNPMEERFGLGARIKAMGGIGISQADDFSATYYNPANLAFSPKTRIGVGYHYLGMNFKLQGHEQRKPEFLPSYHDIYAGICLSLPFKMAIGAYGNFGAAKPVTLEFRTADSKARMALYDNTLSSPSTGLAISIRPIHWFSLGIGTSVTIHSDFVQQIKVPLAPEHIEIIMGGTIGPTLPWVAGLSLEPIPGLRIGAVYRTARYNKFENVSKLHMTLNNIKLLSDFKFDTEQNLEGSFGFSPTQLGLGLSYKLNNILVGSDITWYRWSSFQSPFLIIHPAKKSGFTDIFAYPPKENPKFVNIIIPRFGFEYIWQDILSLRAGYGYRLSPAPIPKTLAQLIDANIHMLSLGSGYKHHWEKLSLSADLFLNAHIASKRNFNHYSLYGFAFDTGFGLNVEY